MNRLRALLILSALIVGAATVPVAASGTTATKTKVFHGHRTIGGLEEGKRLRAPHHTSVRRRVVTNPSAWDREPPNDTRPDTLVDRNTVSTADIGLGLKFRGMPFAGAYPPDTVGDVGIAHYVQAVNSGEGTIVAVFDKFTGGIISAGFIGDLVAGAGDPCFIGLGDPIVLFDQFAQRWLLLEIGGDGLTPNVLCMYVSENANPVTSDWTLSEIVTPQFPDYPKVAVWPDAYYIGTNEPGTPVYAIDRADVLAGAPADVIRKASNAPLVGLLEQLIAPVDLDGAAASSLAGAPGIFIRHRDDEVHNLGANPMQDYIEVWEMSPNFTTLTATLTGPVNIPVAEFSSEVCGTVSDQCFKQRGVHRKLDPLRQFMMNRPQLRIVGTDQLLVGAFTVDFDGHNHGGIRWFELKRPAATTTGGWALEQEGTFAPDNDNRFIPSIAINGSGGIGLGFSVTSKRIYPSIRVTGRRAGDGPGTMKQEITLKKGRHSQGIGVNFGGQRWGDYSSMSVDPSDDETFWYTNEYVGDHSEWRTKVGSFVLP